MRESQGTDSERGYVADVNGNQRISYTRTASILPDGTVQTFGPVTTVSSGLPIFNGVFIFDAPARGEIEAATNWMNKRCDQFTVTVGDTVQVAVDDHLTNAGFRATGSSPGMVLPSLDSIPSNETVVNIERGTTEPAIREYASVFSTVFEIPLETAEKALLPYASYQNDDLQLLLGTVDGDSVACGMMVQSGSVAGVYGIAVIDTYRRRGIGEAMTWAVLQAGKESGCQRGVLVSTEMAYPLYSQMGFETVVTHHEYKPVP